MNHRDLLKKYMTLVMAKEDLNWSYLDNEFPKADVLEWFQGEDDMAHYLNEQDFKELKVIEQEAAATLGLPF